MIAFLKPFRLVNGPSSPVWQPTIKEINTQAWNYVELHRMVGQIDVGMPQPYNMVVARDGAMAIPALQARESDPVEIFNRLFAALLLGGVYCEAIGHDGLEFGSIIDWTFVRSHKDAPSNRFHMLARRKEAAPIEAIELMEPRSIEVSALATAMGKGLDLLNAVPELSGEFLLKGATGFARRDWAAALSNLWIVVEQITSNIWRRRVMEPARKSEVVQGRVDQLADTRTWTIATRHELLHQTGFIPTAVLAKLSLARRARNALAHRGQHPSQLDAQTAYQATLSIMSIAVDNRDIPLQAINLENHALSDPFAPPTRIDGSTLKYWMEIPKLPGEHELELLEAAAQKATHRRDDAKDIQQP